MKKKNLLDYCKYYKGEKENPYEENKAMLWLAERTWHEEYSKNNCLTDFLIDMCEEYNHAGLLNFKETDGVPIAMKATIFRLYTKYCYGTLREAGEDFKIFYNIYY